MKFEMSPTTLFSSSQLIDEIHHLLWIEPFDSRGIWDPGWSCRDHALVVATLLEMWGKRSQLLTGSACFVNGSNGDLPPVGLQQKPHTWVKCEGFGHIDLSIRISRTGVKAWRPLEDRVIVNSAFVPQGGAFTTFSTSPKASEIAIAKASHQVKILNAIYTYTLRDRIYWKRNLIMQSSAYINSPITTRLRRLFGVQDQFHASVALHLFKLVNGEVESLRNVSQEEAWAKLTQSIAGAGATVCERIATAR